jgi:acetyl esterase/lipase
MPINEAIFATIKTASRLKPDAKRSYKLQRVVEGVSAKLASPDPRCRVDDIFAAMPDGYRLPLRVFTPTGETGDMHGAILFIHGGGWVTGSADLYTEACADMALRLRRQVISVDYRRAPEYRFPRAAEDCYEAARQLFAGLLPLPAFGGNGPVDPDDIILFGDSAGGNLVAAVSLMARDRGEFMPCTQMLLYPVVGNDYDPDTTPFASVLANGKDYLLTAQDMADYLSMYQSSPADLFNPYFAPITESDLSDQPRTLVISAEYCPLRDEDETYARRLRQAGNDVSCYRIFNAVHGYFLYPTVSDLVQDTYRIIGHFLDADEGDGYGDASDFENNFENDFENSAESGGNSGSPAQKGDATWRNVLGTD